MKLSTIPASCMYCGQGPEIPGGYICLECEYNASQKQVLPLWMVVTSDFGRKLSLKDDSAARIFRCQECRRILVEFRNALSRAKMEVCPACVLRQEPEADEELCYWCRAPDGHTREQCPIWRDGGLTPENLAGRRLEIEQNLEEARGYRL